MVCAFHCFTAQMFQPFQLLNSKGREKLARLVSIMTFVNFLVRKPGACWMIIVFMGKLPLTYVCMVRKNIALVFRITLLLYCLVSVSKMDLEVM